MQAYIYTCLFLFGHRDTGASLTINCPEGITIPRTGLWERLSSVLCWLLVSQVYFAPNISKKLIKVFHKLTVFTH